MKTRFSFLFVVALPALSLAAVDQLRTPRRLTLTAGTQTNSQPLTYTGCSTSRAEGGWGFCGPDSCKQKYVTCASAGAGPATVNGVTGSFKTGRSESDCSAFVQRTATADQTDWAPRGACSSTCTQQTTGVCSAAFLAGVIAGPGVKYAYCNDKW